MECINLNSSGTHGVIMKTRCPANNVDPLCGTIHSSDFLAGLPVVDESEGIVYRNVFCARCNYVSQVSYWKMEADCGRIPASALPKDNAKLIAFIRENCTIYYMPTDQQQPHVQKCLAAKRNCSLRKTVEKEPILGELCSIYAFPVCGMSYANPHCGLCNGDDITRYDCGCLPPTDFPTSTVSSGGKTKNPTTSRTTTPRRPASPRTTNTRHPTWLWTATPRHPTTNWIETPAHTFPYPLTTPFFPSTNRPFPKPTISSDQSPPTQPPPPPPPPLNILFDFGSNQISIQGKTTEVKQKTCIEGFIYDPFAELCRETFRRALPVANSNSSMNSTNSTMTVVTLNCTYFIRLNASYTVRHPNGTLRVPLYSTEYNPTDYYVNGSYIYVCTNFTSNFSITETTWSYVVSPLQILTYTGCALSVLSLLILVFVYGIFKELRTLPGKNLINLSVAMIFYHIFLFAAGSRRVHEICIVIAVMLHYFLLSSFAWMNVMAFDVVKTFVFRGKKVATVSELKLYL